MCSGFSLLIDLRLKTEEFSAKSPSTLYFQRVLLLTDMFGKLRSSNAHLDISQPQLDQFLGNVRSSRSTSSTANAW